MKNIVALIVAFGCVSPVFSQEASRFELFGGYSFAEHPQLPLSAIPSRNGWEAAIKYNLTSRIGLVAQFDERWGTAFQIIQPSSSTTVFTAEPVKAHTYLFGPEVNVYRRGRVSMNLRGLVGVVHSSDTSTTTSLVSAFNGQQQLLATHGVSLNHFVAALGGNLDVRLGHGFSWRALQPEVRLTSFNSDTRHNFQVATGLVFNFGGR